MPLPKKIPRARSAKPEDSHKRILANRYRVEKRLGSGNFGTAWLVFDLKCKDPKDQLKVLKEIPVGELQPDETVDAMHEANLLRNLDHPGIVKFHDSFIDSEYFCIVTEYCEGGDLDVKITKMRKEGKHLPEPLILEWVIQMLLALQYMHSRRVLHRDLKSRNIFLRNNMIKIGDFGISRILMGTTDMASTFTGTPYYMSPEVLKHEGYNSKSDVWSVGCMLYEMVAQKHAFDGQSLMGVMYKIVEGNLPDWPDSFTKDLQGVFERLLEKDPAKRPSAADALKLPYIEKQMEKLKNTMMDKHIAKENKDSINRDSQQLVMALRQHSNLEQLKRDSETAKWKNMSPRERMRLRKQQQADEEAHRLREAARQQLLDNNKKYQEIKSTMNAYKTQAPPWQKTEQRKEKEREEYHNYGLDRPYTAAVQGLEEEEEEADVLLTVPVEYYQSSHTHGSLSDKRQVHTFAGDDRPITPLKDKMVYDIKNSSLDWKLKDGIPDKPDLADTYYSQFEDEFEDNGHGGQAVGSDIEEVEEDEEEDIEDGEGTLLATVARVPKSEGGEADHADDEVGDLINIMQNALDKSETIKNQTLTDDTIGGAYGPGAREIKIRNLRVECEKKLGKKEFDAAYGYLKQARFGEGRQGGTLDEGQIMKDLKRIVKNPNDCFMVDQLLFLEEQSKLS